jgi:anti-sigma B factor antagonist
MPRPLDPLDTLAGRANALLPRFECTWSEGGLNAAWIHLTGELDVDTTPQLEQTLSDPDSQAGLIVVDMREVAFMDSSGVHAIVNASARARQRGRRLVVLRGPPDVDRVFSLTGNGADVENGDVEPLEPSVQALLRLGAEDGPS